MLSTAVTFCRPFRDFVERKSTEHLPPIDIKFSLENPNSLDKFGAPPLYYAILWGDASHVRELLNKHAEVNLIFNYTYIFRASLMSLAVKRGDPEIVEALAYHGAKLDKSVPEDINPLSIALRYDCGSDIDHDKKFYTSEKIIAILQKHRAEAAYPMTTVYTAPLYAASTGNIALLRELQPISNYVFKKMYHDGNALLHIAAKNGHYKIVEYLLNHDNNINRQNVDGYTPLHFAAMNENLSVMVMLIEKGADFNIKDNKGRTALSYLNATSIKLFSPYIAQVIMKTPAVQANPESSLNTITNPVNTFTDPMPFQEQTWAALRPDESCAAIASNPNSLLMSPNTLLTLGIRYVQSPSRSRLVHTTQGSDTATEPGDCFSPKHRTRNT